MKNKMIVWKVTLYQERPCLFEFFSEAWEAFKSGVYKGSMIYPVLIDKNKFDALPDHEGWEV